jgi:hypothetical protein
MKTLKAPETMVCNRIYGTKENQLLRQAFLIFGVGNSIYSLFTFQAKSLL